MAYHLRALLLAVACGEQLASLLEITPEDAKRYAQQASRFSQSRLLRLLDLYMRVESELKWASSPRIALEAASLKACLPSTEDSAEALMERVAELERKLQNGLVAVPAPLSPVPAATVPKQAEPEVRAQPASKAEKAMGQEAEKKTAPVGLTPLKVWEQTMQTLKKTDTSLFSQLAACSFGGLKGDVYRVMVPKANPFAIKYLNQDARKAAIAAALTQTGGTPVRFEALMEGQENPEQERREQALVQGLIADFGRDKVQIDEE
jgi:DNA polymerase-3 subunit gamma/tau